MRLLGPSGVIMGEAIGGLFDVDLGVICQKRLSFWIGYLIKEFRGLGYLILVSKINGDLIRKGAKEFGC